jgi:hypothetical protein
MAGYIRNDTANNIADGNIINASDFDGEFDSIQAAFVNTTGHTHDGTAAEGAPITKIGPAQDVVASATTLNPKTTNTVDLGTNSLKFKDIYAAGTAYVATLDLTNALTVADGGTGAITLTGYVKGSGTSAFTAAATIPVADLSGTLPVGNGGTGATTLTGVLKGNGTLAFTAAVAGTDYVTPTGTETLTNKTLTNPTVNNYTEGVVAIGTVTTSNTLSLTNGTVQTATLTASTACTFTMPTATAGKSFVLLLKQAVSTGNGSATFTGVKWSTLGAPTITATAGKMDILSFVSDGTNWYGSFVQGYTP